MPSPSDNGFAGILSEDFSVLQRNGKARHFLAGDVIFSAGDPGDGFYVIESGRVDISAAIGGGESRLLASIGPADFFGEMAVLDDEPRSATATAAVDTATCFLGREQLWELLEHRPRFALNLIREFSARMRALNRKYLEEIVQAERLAVIGRFARTIVHDFKNPLTTISLAAELTGNETTSPLLRGRGLHQIERQIVRMTNMLNELIDFTRPPALQPPLQPANFAQFLVPLVAELRDDIAGRGVTLELVDPAPDLELPFQPTRLSRLFYNLVNNAVQEMPDGGKILIRLAHETGALRIEVQDTGPGIAPEIAQQLFRPFATHGKAHGTGLGLSICKKIVEDHGGRIWVQSAPDRGATFCFTLPLAKA